MRYYSSIVKLFKITPKHHTMLGRWNLCYKESVIKQKVDWANEDHCGPCGIQMKVEKDTLKLKVNK